MQAIRQAAFSAQENRMRVQAFALFDAMDARGLAGLITRSAEVTGALDDECSSTKSSANKSDGSHLIAPGSAAENPVASG